MQLLSKLRDAISDTRIIADGQAAGLKIAARHADPNFARGTYERPLQEAIAGNLDTGGVFYDVGANIGFFSIIAARRVGAAGRVYAFEPVAANAASITKSAQLNGFATIEVFPVAVGATSGSAELKLARHIGGAVLASVGDPPDMRGHVEVSVVTLDGVIAQRQLRPPSLVKIDVEGAEIDVLTGMQATLREHRPIVIYEVDDASGDRLRSKANAIASFMTAAGYALTSLPPAYASMDWHVEHVLARPSPQ
jgi:FkbM family methyltransferase